MTLPIRLLQIFHIICITPIMFYKDIIIYSSLIIKKKFFFTVELQGRVNIYNVCSRNGIYIYIYITINDIYIPKDVYTYSFFGSVDSKQS